MAKPSRRPLNIAVPVFSAYVVVSLMKGGDVQGE